LEKAEISTYDFAGYVKNYNSETQDYDYFLRYSEFVALNTWQIQKLKNKVSELENKIAQLEGVIKNDN
jgi:hypothetical protein